MRISRRSSRDATTSEIGSFHLKPQRRPFRRRAFLRSPMGRLLRPFLHRPELWRTGGGCLARGLAIGGICTWIPIPFQMILAGMACYVFRANVIGAFALVWISNPLTYAPMGVIAYSVGSLLVGDSILSASTDANETLWFTKLFLGCVVMGCMTSVIGWSVGRWWETLKRERRLARIRRRAMRFITRHSSRQNRRL